MASRAPEPMQFKTDFDVGQHSNESAALAYAALPLPRVLVLSVVTVSAYILKLAAVPQPGVSLVYSMAGVWDYGNEDDIEPLKDSSGEAYCHTRWNCADIDQLPDIHHVSAAWFKALSGSGQADHL